VTDLLLGIPFLKIGSIGPIQGFGVIVMIGVLIGASVLARHGRKHGMKPEDISGLETWIMVTGFLGAHIFYVFAYEPARLLREPWWILKVWDGIASYGGFLGGAIGFAWFVRSRKLPARRTADTALVGLLLAFSIGRLGCTLVSDHVGLPLTNPDAWYGFLAMDYPRSAAAHNGNIADLFRHAPPGVDMIRAWNLGLIELLYLIPVNAIVLFLAFRREHQPGFLAVLVGALYAPVRFFLEYPRLENSDPRWAGFTFAQWMSLVAFAATVALAIRLRTKPTPPSP
jgi:phosphatidylglycerol---prolipoprotein diacylglyceryl transferase